MDPALIQAARDAAAKLFGDAAADTRAQQAAIDAAYANASGAVVGNAAGRNAGDQQYADQRNQDLSSFARRTGGRAAPTNDRALSQSLQEQQQMSSGTGQLWKEFFDNTKGTALGRNESQATAFEQARNLKQEELDQDLAAAIAASYGGGGGGRGGGGGGSGNYWEDEDVWTPPDTGEMTANLVRGLAASQRRYEGQAEHYAQTGQSANTGTPGKTKTKLRRGGGGQF